MHRSHVFCVLIAASSLTACSSTRVAEAPSRPFTVVEATIPEMQAALETAA